MITYTVEWRIEVEASSSEDAAKLARKIQVGGYRENVFQVTAKGNDCADEILVIDDLSAPQ